MSGCWRRGMDSKMVLVRRNVEYAGKMDGREALYPDSYYVLIIGYNRGV